MISLERIAELIHEKIGVYFKKERLEILKYKLEIVMHRLGLSSYEEVYRTLLGEMGEERYVELIDGLVVNTTEFFRQKKQFEFLMKKILPQLLGLNRKIKVLSAGCSTGEEPYSICLSFLETMRLLGKFQPFEVFGVDISKRALIKAIEGVYSMDKLQKVPRFILERYFDVYNNVARVKKDVKKFVRFIRMNLKNFAGVNEEYDVIFFRNVLIYFDRKDQIRVLSNLCNALKKNGYLFSGYSESLRDFDLPLVSIAPAVYKKL